jgi:hypothetical protein
MQDVVEAVRDGGDLAISQEVLVTDQGQWTQDFFSYICFFVGFETVKPNWELYGEPFCYTRPVLQIRDVYPGSDFFPSRIPDPKCLHPGSRISIKEFKYFNPQKTKKMVSKL